MDVYRWEAPGKGSCDPESPSYFASNGGCLHLISSGESPFESEFWDADPDGSDVFLSTESSLVPQDPGSVDVYDARVGGGFAQPVARESCEGEACQSPPAAPDDPTPASSALEGAGNVAEPPPSCRLAALKAKRLSREAKRLRRAARRAKSPARSRALRKRTKGAAKRAKRASKKAKRCQRANRNRRAPR